MRKVRLIGFFLAILLGVAGGMALGWKYFPAEISQTTFSDLRPDYKADYVLMVAEKFAADADLEAALISLDVLNPGNPLAAVRQSLLTAEEMGFAEWEMHYIADLEVSVSEAQMAGVGN